MAAPVGESTTSVVDVNDIVVGRDVLFVLAGEADRNDALVLPFRDASVIESDLSVISTFDGVFNALVISERQLSTAWAAGVRRLLRPDSIVVVLLALDAPDEPAIIAARQIDDLAWQGVGSMGGRPCATLTLGNGSGRDVAELIAVGGATARLATALRHSELAAVAEMHEMAKAGLDRQVSARRASERALLDALDRVAAQMDTLRADYRGIRLVRTVLRRHTSGRVLLRAVRPVATRLLRLRRRLRLSDGKL